MIVVNMYICIYLNKVMEIINSFKEFEKNN